MKKMIQNYSNPTPRKWRINGDIALLVSLLLWLLEDFIAAAPASILDPEITHWVVKGVGGFAIIFKIYTNTKVDPNQYIGKV